MPDRRKHRGAHPEDQRLFGEQALPALRVAVGELSWLLSRGYASKAALKLVGDRHGLNRRQQLAVRRCTCSDGDRQCRRARCVEMGNLKGRELRLDGFNVLTSLEAALGGGVILHARDGCFRDMASMHGTYRTVEETRPALNMIGCFVEQSGVSHCTWYLDRPVANSGRLRGVMQQEAEAAGWSWEVELVPSPDRILRESGDLVATADSGILDRGVRWINLARAVVEAEVEGAWIVDLSGF